MASRGTLNFVSIPGSGVNQADENRLTDIVEKTAINKLTASGQVNTPDEAQAVAQYIEQNAPSTLYTQSKLLDYANTGAQLQSKVSDVTQNVDLFDADLKQKLLAAAQADINNPTQLVADYAAIYSDASDQYDATISNDVLDKYDAPPSGVMQYSQTLKQKASMMASLYNSYQMANADGTYGPENPNGYAVLVSTNPSTGKIANVDIVDAKDVPTGYMRTDVGTDMLGSSDANVKSAQIPMYLQGTVSGTDSKGKSIYSAKLGGLNFQSTGVGSSDSSANAILALQRTDAGDGFLHELFTPDQAGSIKKQGINLGNSQAFQFDSTDIPNNSVVHIGTKAYFQDSSGKLLPIDGTTSDEMNANLQAYYTMAGVNPQNVHDFYATSDYVANPDGSSKIGTPLSADTTSATTTPTTPTASGAGPVSVLNFGGTPAGGTNTTTPSTQLATAAQPSTSFFANRTNKPNKPDTAPVAPEGQPINGNAVIAAGASFFKKVGSALGIA